jgi:hypothetical protein
MSRVVFATAIISNSNASRIGKHVYATHDDAADVHAAIAASVDSALLTCDEWAMLTDATSFR